MKNVVFVIKEVVLLEHVNKLQIQVVLLFQLQKDGQIVGEQIIVIGNVIFLLL